MKIEKHRVVSIHYVLTNDAGAELDSSAGMEPLVYLHGVGNIIPGLEKALEGRTTGDRFQVEVQPDEGYGPVHQELIETAPRTAFEGIDELEVGMQFQAQGAGGEVRRITVISVDEAVVKVDGNHPLAGEVLHFDIMVADVREATDEEVAHGHVH
jgi:FKBP-type peptidyl-prolyl cis-trans isomerase SlyD